MFVQRCCKKMRRSSLPMNLFVAAVILAVSGCAVVPPESVKLSSSIGQDVAAIKKSHVFYINSFYDRLVYEATRAIDNEFAPQLITAALNGASGKVLMQKLEAGKAGDGAAIDAVDFTQAFLTSIKTRVDQQKTSIIGKIEEARHTALANVDSAYTQALQGNDTLTAYLTSLQKLHSAQSDLFSLVGTPSLPDEAATKLAGVSDTIEDWTTKAKKGEASLDDVTMQIQQFAASAASDDKKK